MKIRPILFGTKMVQAILEGRKTQTRRIIKPQPTNPRRNNIGWLGWDDGHGYRINAPCEPGDILWVRETWDFAPSSNSGPCQFVNYYKADGDLRPVGWRVNWHPSIHMPKEAARIFLRVKDVWPERLKDIHEKYQLGPGHPVAKEGLGYLCDFIATWENTIKPADRFIYGWDANPWVWVIEFERCEKPEGWEAYLNG